MVKHVSIQNFKSIKSLEFEAKRVNIFVGEPNAGKSNILEALGIFSVFSTTNGISEVKTTLRFKTSDDLFFDNDVSKPIMIICDNYRAVCNEGDLNVNFNVVYDDASDPIFYGNLEISNEGIYSGRINNDMSPFKFYKFQIEENLNNSARLYLQPPTGKNLFYVLKANSVLRNACNEVLVSKGYRLGLRMKTGEIEVLRDTGKEIIQYPYQTLSDTLQRIIFYFAAIDSNKNSILLFEEPEANTFPYYTKQLAERIAADESNQYFLVTHNPYFLNSLVQQTPIEQLNVFVTYMEDYQTKLRKLAENDFSKILDLDKEVFYNLDILGQPA